MAARPSWYLGSGLRGHSRQPIDGLGEARIWLHPIPLAKSLMPVQMRESLKQFAKVLGGVQLPTKGDNIFIFATPRSGSSWLMELILSQPQLPAHQVEIVTLDATLARLGDPDPRRFAVLTFDDGGRDRDSRLKHSKNAGGARP